MKTTSQNTESGLKSRPEQLSMGNKHQADSAFGELIYAYTRAQALADGVHVDISTVAAEAGIRFPVFVTRAAFDACVTVAPNVIGQDEAG